MAQQPQNYFARSFNNFVNKLPYTGNSTVIDNISELNPKFRTFYNVGTTQQEKNLKQAVSIVQDPNNPVSNLNGVIIDKGYHDYLYALIDTDKGKRIADYRIMASYAEISHALDEFCDDALVKDDKGKYAQLHLSERLDEGQKKELEKNFNQVIDLFNLDTKGWEYFRTILIDAELFFENVINEENKEAGIISLVQIPTEHINPIFDNVQNMIIKGYLLQKPKPKEENKGGFVNNRGPSGGPQKDGMDLVPLERHQVTYLHSHIWNENKTIRLPYLEVARRAYKQLSLIEDSIVVYRLVRAPERLAFYVDVGNMPSAKAEAYLKRLMQNYWSKRTYDNQQGGNVNVYDPQSMLDSYWFARRNGEQGTKVEVLKGGANLGQLDDLNYFVKKLYKALRVPSSRLTPDTKFADGTEILREELKFARLIIRLQRQFASSIRDTLITHLKLKGLWKDYGLRENDIGITLNPPSHFAAMRDQQLLDIKFNNLKNATATENLISRTYALKKFMNFSDDEVLANREWLKKDAAFAWELDKITTLGNNWKEAMTMGQGPEGQGGPGGGGGGAAPGAMNAPSFGPGPGAGAAEIGPGPEAGGAAPAAPAQAPAAGGSALPPG